MPRSANPVPSYSLHKPTGQAHVRLPDGNGGRRVVYLGKHGSPESQAEYRRILAELQTQAVTTRPAPVTGSRPADLTVNEVIIAFLRWADTHYRDPPSPPQRETEVEVIAADSVIACVSGHWGR
jgi:hypothetical protein